MLFLSTLAFHTHLIMYTDLLAMQSDGLMSEFKQLMVEGFGLSHVSWPLSHDATKRDYWTPLYQARFIMKICH